jgi:hypothetical protein
MALDSSAEDGCSLEVDLFRASVCILFLEVSGNWL